MGLARGRIKVRASEVCHGAYTRLAANHEAMPRSLSRASAGRDQGPNHCWLMHLIWLIHGRGENEVHCAVAGAQAVVLVQRSQKLAFTSLG